MSTETPLDDAMNVADGDLVERARGGDATAFGELWSRHYRAGVTVARSITSSIDADDLVQEAYTRIYQAIQRGGGPTGAFRAYLFTSIRNAAASWGRARNESAIDELDNVADPTTTDAETEAALDRGLTHTAFRSLPTRWQEVLWYTEIEQMKPAKVAPLLGMKPTAVAQLALRAREGLREAWITAHLKSLDDGSMCQWTRERLGAYSRDTVSARDKAKMDAHLAECARCAIVASEAADVSSRLALVLLPLVLGASGATAYLASLQGGGQSLVALAAGTTPVMPSTVVGGGSAGSAAAVASAGAASPAAAATSATGSQPTSIAPQQGDRRKAVLWTAAGVILLAASLAIFGAVALPKNDTAPRAEAPADTTSTAEQPQPQATVSTPVTAPTPSPEPSPEQDTPEPSPAPSVVPTPTPPASPQPTTPATATPAPSSPADPSEPAPNDPQPTTPPTTEPTPAPDPLDARAVSSPWAWYAEFTLDAQTDRVISVYVNDVKQASRVVVDGSVTIGLTSETWQDDMIYFAYDDGALERTVAQTGREWAAGLGTP